MSLTSGFYNSTAAGDRRYTADQMGEMFEGLFNDGVFQHVDDAFRVRMAANGVRAVDVLPGRAWIKNHWIKNSTSFQITVDPSAPGQVRTADVYLVMDGNSNVRAASLEIPGYTITTLGVDGYPTSFPGLLQNTSLKGYLRLATVVVIGDDVDKWYVLDQRGREGCPWISAMIDSWDSAKIYANWDARYDKFRKEKEEFVSSSFNQQQAARQADYERWKNGIVNDLSENNSAKISTRLTDVANDVEKVKRGEYAKAYRDVGSPKIEHRLEIVTDNGYATVPANELVERYALGNLARKRSVVRGKSLGKRITAEQKAAIASGTFDGICLGDYWEGNCEEVVGFYPEDDQPPNRLLGRMDFRLVVVDFNYWLEAIPGPAVRTGPMRAVTQNGINHVVVMVDRNMFQITPSGGGYDQDRFNSVHETILYSKGVDTFKRQLNQAFPNTQLLKHNETFEHQWVTAYEGNYVFEHYPKYRHGAVVDIGVPSENMIYGTHARRNHYGGSYNGIDEAPWQLAYFNLTHQVPNPYESFWLKDASWSTFICSWDAGIASADHWQNPLGYRPVFGIIG